MLSHGSVPLKVALCAAKRLKWPQEQAFWLRPPCSGREGSWLELFSNCAQAPSVALLGDTDQCHAREPAGSFDVCLLTSHAQEMPWPCPVCHRTRILEKQMEERQPAPVITPLWSDLQTICSHCGCTHTFQ